MLKGLFKKVIISLLLLYFLLQLTINHINNLKLVTTNEEFIKSLLVDPEYHLKYKKNLFSILSKFITNFDPNNPLTVLEKNMSANKKVVLVSNKDNLITELEKVSQHISDPYGVKVSDPRVYIYNSHQLENYNNKNLDIYNITPNVMMASYLLKEKLNQLKIPTVAEDADIVDFMRLNSWTHKDSYRASRFYIIDALNNYQNLDLIIDLHRDDLSKTASTTVIDGKKYAKVLFVVGLENKSYQDNLQLANKIDKLLKEKYPTLSRGVLTKKGAGVDGIYNQDLSPKMILLELGASENTIDEVLNTINVISVIIKDLIGVSNE